MTAGFVRAARASDAAGLASVQVASWRVSLAGLVPQAVLDELTSADAQRRWAERWLEAIIKPPTSRHRIHVAVGAPAGVHGAGEEGGAPVVHGAGGALGCTGFASAGPATDPDLWAGTDGELYELHVLPDQAGLGHDGRLLHAVADTLAEDGFRTACTWALAGDDTRLEFLRAAGWAPDGSHGNLDMGVKVPVVRLHTGLATGG